MGYTTQFKGAFTLTPRLLDMHALYLLEFPKTRRVKWNVAQLCAIPDPGRDAVDLPLGTEGEFFIHVTHAQAEAAILDYNRSPSTQPSLWCQWVPTADGSGIEWDGNEKFYRYVEWLQYLIHNFLHPWGYQLDGSVTWQGETVSDQGEIIVANSQIIQPSNAQERLTITTTPIQVPLLVWQGFFTIHTVDPTCLTSWISAIDQAKKLGYAHTERWIEENLRGLYAAGVDRGFQAIETGEQFVPTCCPIGSWVN